MQITFHELFDIWKVTVLPNRQRSLKSRQTVVGYIENHVMLAFHDLFVNEITTVQIQLLFSKMHLKNGKRMADSTKHKILSNLTSLFESGLVWGYLEYNPCVGVKLATPVYPEFKTWTIEQTTYFLNLNFVKNSIYYIPFLLLSTTGMRRSECCGLKWSDFDGTSLVLKRGLDTFGNVTNMKTRSSHRKIELMQFVCDVLSSCVRYSDYICHAENNDILLPDTLTKVFKKFILKNNSLNDYQLPVIQLKNLRHSLATNLLLNDVNVKVVSELLGHSKTSTTQDFYQSSATKTIHRESIEKIEKMMF